MFTLNLVCYHLKVHPCVVPGDLDNTVFWHTVSIWYQCHIAFSYTTSVMRKIINVTMIDKSSNINFSTIHVSQASLSLNSYDQLRRLDSLITENFDSLAAPGQIDWRPERSEDSSFGLIASLDLWMSFSNRHTPYCTAKFIYRLASGYSWLAKSPHVKKFKNPRKRVINRKKNKVNFPVTIYIRDRWLVIL